MQRFFKQTRDFQSVILGISKIPAICFAIKIKQKLILLLYGAKFVSNVVFLNGRVNLINKNPEIL